MLLTFLKRKKGVEEKRVCILTLHLFRKTWESRLSCYKNEEISSIFFYWGEKKQCLDSSKVEPHFISSSPVTATLL